MYKLFLCLRYLKRRVIAYFAVLAVALCVAMMLIVISVMNGFLDKIEQAAKGLFGDVVVDSDSLDGFGYYDEFIAEVHQQVPEVEAASPFIMTYGLLSVPGTHARRTVEVAGIRLPQQTTVTDFADGLHFQQELIRQGLKPSFDPPLDGVQKQLQKDTAQARELLDKEQGPYDNPETMPVETAETVSKLSNAIHFWHEPAEGFLEHAKPYQDPLARTLEQLQAAETQAAGRRTEQIEQLELRLEELQEQSRFLPPSHRIILGLGIPGFSLRTDEGETVRFLVPGYRVVLWVVPMGQQMSDIDIVGARDAFTVIDDCRTDVSSIDTEIVYVPFETLQRLNNMVAVYAADDGEVLKPARCSQIHIKVRPAYANGRELQRVCDRINEVWLTFRQRYPDASSTNVSVQTWRQRQMQVIAPIEKQRTLVVTMFGIISLVSVVLIFVIFYTIVVQKTRDIGVLKAVGASSGGVAQIFLAYGAMIGLVGSILGCVGGYYFVRYINPIQDTIDRWFGFRVWSKEWFLFEKIPNQVEPTTALLIMIGAILAGVLGALIPAFRAARMQPVEALRYE